MDELFDARRSPLPPRVQAARERARAALPTGYNPWLHLAAPFVTGGVVIAACVACLEGPGLVDLAVVPLFWLLSIAAEWRLHRDLLHKRKPPFHFFYDAHTVSHHAMYVEGAMEISAAWELRGVLFPAWATAVLAALLSPIAWLVGQVMSHDAGLLVLATGMAYMMTYEFLHLSFHLPRRHPLRRSWVIAWLSRNHERHHDPRRMQRYSFGVTTALWDRVRGTVARD